MTVKDLQEQRAKLVADARAIADKAKTEKRDMTAEERGQFEKIMDVSLIELADKISKAEADEKRFKTLETLEGSDGRKTTPPTPGAGHHLPPQDIAERFMVLGKDVYGTERRMNLSGPRSTPEYNRAWRNYLLTGERRDLQADDDTGGGFLQAPQQFVGEYIIFLNNLLFVRQRARVLPPVATGNGVGIPSIDADVADGDWTAEIKTGSKDTSLAIGKRELKPHPLAKRVLISNKLLRAAAINPETLVSERLAYKMAVPQERAFLTGTGAGQPLGVFTASAQGISTGRDVSTSNTTTSMTYDGLINAKYSLKAQYWTNASWTFHRDGIKQVSTLKDGVGRYLFEAGVNGKPDSLLGFPVDVSEYAPNTFTTGQYVGLLGNWQYYYIVDSLSMTVQKLIELYAETNQTGYIARLETDGAPVLEEAFARVKLA